MNKFRLASPQIQRFFKGSVGEEQENVGAGQKSYILQATAEESEKTSQSSAGTQADKDGNQQMVRLDLVKIFGINKQNRIQAKKQRVQQSAFQHWLI
jgi:hypothetical protein